MVDVFEVGPGSNRGSAALFPSTGHNVRSARYQHLVSKLNSDDDETSQGVKVDWLSDDEDLELESNKPASIKTLEDDQDGPLVGTFADAAAAMK